MTERGRGRFWEDNIIKEGGNRMMGGADIKGETIPTYPL